MLAFTFPGQGSQKPAMGAPWVDHPSWELVKDISEASGRDVEHLLLHADADELKETRNSQLATFVMSMIVLDAVERLGVQPSIVAGHSLGEYSALVAAGALSLTDGSNIVVERGEAMQSAAGDQDGTMYAVLGLDDEQVDVACRRADGDVWVANYNAPGQVVIAGAPDALERAGGIAKELGAKRAMALPVGGAFHTPYMASARERLRKALENAMFREPEVPIVANVDATVHDSSAGWLELCSAQMLSPVRWRQSVERLASSGVTMLVELGPGAVLTGLAKRIAPDLQALPVNEPDHLDALLEAAAGLELRAADDVYEGEHLYMHERLIVSTATGLYKPTDQDPSVGTSVAVGDVVATIGDTQIRSAFAGTIMGTLAIDGERVSVGQPVAWLRTEQANA